MTHRGDLRRFLAPALLLAGFALAAPPQSGAETPGDLQQLWRAGEEAYESGDYERALDSFNRALEVDSSQSRTWNYLGGIHFSQGNYLKSLLHFKQALALNPSDARACNNIGTAYERLGQNEKAETFYLRAIEIDQSYALPYRNLGVLYAERLDRPKMAQTYWERFLELSPPGPDADAVREQLRALGGPH